MQPITIVIDSNKQKIKDLNNPIETKIEGDLKNNGKVEKAKKIFSSDLVSNPLRKTLDLNIDDTLKSCTLSFEGINKNIYFINLKNVEFLNEYQKASVLNNAGKHSVVIFEKITVEKNGLEKKNSPASI